MTTTQSRMNVKTAIKTAGRAAERSGRSEKAGNRGGRVPPSPMNNLLASKINLR